MNSLLDDVGPGVPRNFKLRFGASNPKTKLTEDQVIEIVGHIAGGKPYTAIAKMYNIADRTVSDIHNRKTWTALTSGHSMPPRVREKALKQKKNTHRPHLKVLPKDYPKIETLYMQGSSYAKIGKLYGVSGSTIRGIVHRLDIYTINNWKIAENVL